MIQYGWRVTYMLAALQAAFASVDDVASVVADVPSEIPAPVLAPPAPPPAPAPGRGNAAVRRSLREAKLVKRCDRLKKGLKNVLRMANPKLADACSTASFGLGKQNTRQTFTQKKTK